MDMVHCFFLFFSLFARFWSPKLLLYVTDPKLSLLLDLGFYNFEHYITNHSLRKWDDFVMDDDEKMGGDRATISDENVELGFDFE